jgi:AraC-like DNA-binding protein
MELGGQMSERAKKVSDRLKTNDNFDVLADILETLRFSGTIFFRSELAAPWGMSLDQEAFPRFHISLSGDCYIGSEKEETVKIEQGEIIMLPGGDSHWIADRPGRMLISSARAGEACELGNPLFQKGDITNRLMCGLVQFETASSHPFLDSLPGILHFPGMKPTDSIWMTVTLIDAEMQRTRSAGSLIIDRLTEVLFLQLLNCHINRSEESAGFLAALQDRRVHLALKLIHSEPGFNWSLTSLGERIGMSRATLVRHFQQAIGVAPMSYILNWRVTKAFNLIKHTSMSLEQIADVVGFATARTMSRSFQRHYKFTPSKLRQGLL